MIKVFTDPLMIDYLQIATNLAADQRLHLEAMTGVPYDIDSAAVGNFISPGPKWVIKVGQDEQDFLLGKARAIVVGGFNPTRPGVWRDFLLTTEDAFTKEFWFTVTRVCKRAMDSMFQSGMAHRLECVVPAARLESRPELADWYKLLGYNKEGLHHGYCASGADAVSFARVKH
jgi:hypothetical protein